METLLVYPFCREVSDFLRCSDMVVNYSSILPVSLDSLAMTGKDAGVSDGGGITGHLVRNDFRTALSEADAVFISTAPMISDIDIYREQVDLTIKSGKKLFVTETLSQLLGDSCSTKGIEVLGYEDVKINPDRFTNLLSLPVPIIFVMGTGENCDKFTLELKLGKFFKSKGYHVLQYGTKPFSRMFGMKTVPRLLFEDRSVKSKIYDFNRAIYADVKAEKPELVIMGIPGGIIPGNPFRFGDFGECAYVIANAFTPDVSILSTYSQAYTAEFYSHLIATCKYRYNSVVNYVNVANMDYFVSFEYKTDEYIRVPTEKLGEVFGDFSAVSSNVRYFSSFDESSFSNAAERILMDLTDNI